MMTALLAPKQAPKATLKSVLFAFRDTVPGRSLAVEAIIYPHRRRMPWLGKAWQVEKLSPNLQLGVRMRQFASRHVGRSLGDPAGGSLAVFRSHVSLPTGERERLVPLSLISRDNLLSEAGVLTCTFRFVDPTVPRLLVMRALFGPRREVERRPELSEAGWSTTRVGRNVLAVTLLAHEPPPALAGISLSQPSRRPAAG